MMFWSLWCAAVVVFSVCADAAAGPSGLMPYELREVDEDTYAVAPLNTRRDAAPGAWMYFVGDEPHDSQGQNSRVKRHRDSLSIDLPMSLIRENLNLKKERLIHAQQAAVNRNFLNDIGKRGMWKPSVEYQLYE